MQENEKNLKPQRSESSQRIFSVKPLSPVVILILGRCSGSGGLHLFDH
jgi:hypothetical protein